MNALHTSCKQAPVRGFGCFAIRFDLPPLLESGLLHDARRLQWTVSTRIDAGSSHFRVVFAKSESAA